MTTALTDKPLNSLERTQLRNAEKTIGEGLKTFMDVGQALFDIREGSLHRETHRTFDAYCRDKWGFSRQRAHQLIEAAETTANLSTIVDTPPANEAQARELSRVPEEQRADVWQDVLERTGGNPTARDVHEVAETYLADNEPYEEEGEGAEGEPEEAEPVVTKKDTLKTLGQLTRQIEGLNLLSECRPELTSLKKKVRGAK